MGAAKRGYALQLALEELWGRIGDALGWLWSRNRLPINTLWSGFGVALEELGRPVTHHESPPALGGCARPFEVGSWMLDVRCSVFTISLPNTTLLPRPLGGGLEEVWYHPGPTLYP